MAQYVTEPQFSSKKKFYFKNLLDENSKIDFVQHYRLLQLLKQQTFRKSQPTVISDGSPRNEYKPLYSITSPKNEKQYTTLPTSFTKRTRTILSQRLNSESIPTLISNFETETIAKPNQSKRQNIKQRRPVGGNQIEQMDIQDYLLYLKQKNKKEKKQLELPAQKDSMVSINQLKQIHFKSQKAEHFGHLQKMYYCSYAVFCMSTLKQISIQDLVNNYLQQTHQKQTNQFSQIEQIVDQFLSDLDIASRIYNSEKLKSSALSKITGIDYKIFNLLYKNKKEQYPKLQDYVIDENFNNNYVFQKITRNDIFYRILGAGDLPLIYIDHLPQLFDVVDYTPHIYLAQFRDKDYKYMKQKIENDYCDKWTMGGSRIEIDLDFIRRLLYYQKNLQISLRTKQNDIITNKQLSLQQFKKPGFRQKTDESEQTPQNIIKEQQTLLYRLEDSENVLGLFPIVSRQNRYFYENLDNVQKIQLKIKHQ